MHITLINNDNFEIPEGVVSAPPCPPVPAPMDKGQLKTDLAIFDCSAFQLAIIQSVAYAYCCCCDVTTLRIARKPVKYARLSCHCQTWLLKTVSFFLRLSKECVPYHIPLQDNSPMDNSPNGQFTCGHFAHGQFAHKYRFFVKMYFIQKTNQT